MRGLLFNGTCIARIREMHVVAAELRTGDGPVPIDGLGAFLQDALGPEAEPPPFPDLGPPAPTG